MIVLHLPDTELGQDLESGNAPFPSPAQLVGTNTIMPYVLVGDEAFQLLENVMRPYLGKCLPKDELIFNYRLSRARMVVECTFGIMVAHWRIYHRMVEMLPHNMDFVILATCVLHNFLRTEDEAVPNHCHQYCPPGYLDQYNDE